MNFQGMRSFLLVMCCIGSEVHAMDSGRGRGVTGAGAPAVQSGVLTSFAGLLGCAADAAKKSVNKVAYGDPDIYLLGKMSDGSLALCGPDERRGLLNEGFREWTKKIDDECAVLERRKERETAMAKMLLEHPDFLAQVSPDILVQAKHAAQQLALIAQQVEEQFTHLLDEQSQGIHRVIEPPDGDA